VKSSCGRGNEPSGFHKMLGNYPMASQLVASRVVLSSIGLYSHLQGTGYAGWTTGESSFEFYFRQKQIYM
jgi:hypothetical protein